MRWLPVIAALLVGCQGSRPLVDDPGKLTDKYNVDGKEVALGADGFGYERVGSKWKQLERVFDPEVVRRSYVKEGDAIYRVDLDSGKRYRTIQGLTMPLRNYPEGRKGIQTLVGPESGFTEFTLQTPQTPTVPEYVQLRTDILAGNREFGDASITSNRQAIRFSAPACPSSMICTKASITNGLVHFVSGDDFWFEAEFKIDGAMPLTLADLETDLAKESPGIRLRFFDGDYLGAELKSVVKRDFKQSKFRFPKGEWVKVKWRVALSAQGGTVQIWSDDQLILKEGGPNMPFSSAIMNSLELGATAHVDPKEGTNVELRRLRVSNGDFDQEDFLEY